MNAEKEEHSDEPKRRLSDKLFENTDHDLIIRHSVKIDHMCNLVKDIGKKFDKYAERIDQRCEHRKTEMYDMIGNSSEDVMPKDTIKWILGFIIIGLISMVGVVGYNQVKIQGAVNVQNESLKQIKNNQKSIEKLQRIIDLKINQIPLGNSQKDTVSDIKQLGEILQ